MYININVCNNNALYIYSYSIEPRSGHVIISSKDMYININICNNNALLL